MSRSLGDIVGALGGELVGNASLQIHRLAPLATARADELSVVAQARYAAQIQTTAAGALISPAGLRDAAMSRGACIVCDDPYLYFARLTQWWKAQHEPAEAPRVDPSASIHPSAVIGDRVSIGPFAVVGPGARIGDGARIGPHSASGVCDALRPHWYKALAWAVGIQDSTGPLAVTMSLVFLADMGMEEPGLNRVIRAGFRLLGLQTYFTAGVKEVRAWTIHIGDTAPQAAGVIHTDFERGFIRAQTIAYEDYIAHKGEQGAKEAGKMRAEGKEYLVKDGDVLNFLFNV